MIENGPGHDLQNSPKTPEQKGVSIEMALRETVKAIFPITTRIYQKEDWRFSYDEKRGYPYIDPDTGPRGLGKDGASNIIYGVFGDVMRIAAGRFILAFSDLDGVKLAATMGIIFSPNLVHLASKNRLIRETGKTGGRKIAKVAKDVLKIVRSRPN